MIAERRIMNIKRRLDEERQLEKIRLEMEDGKTNDVH